MRERNIIILAAQDRSLLGLLRERRPGLDVCSHDGTLPSELVGSRIWCFIDWLLPDISGLELCRQMRISPITERAHITIAIDPACAEARQLSVMAGVDDYLSGPLNIQNLLERLDLYANGSHRNLPKDILVYGDLEIDAPAYRVRYKGKPLPIATNEFRLLVGFAQNPDRVLTRKKLIDLVGKDSDAINEQTVDVWVRRLRQAFRSQQIPDPLRTVRSVGYVFDGVGD